MREHEELVMLGMAVFAVLIGWQVMLFIRYYPSPFVIANVASALYVAHCARQVWRER
jgi:hypothetical protein